MEQMRDYSKQATDALIELWAEMQPLKELESL